MGSEVPKFEDGLYTTIWGHDNHDELCGSSIGMWRAMRPDTLSN